MDDVSLVVAIAFALILFGSHKVILASRLPKDILRSLGGGMAASYVFLQLMPELEEIDELIGFSGHIWMLAGFLLFCGLQHLLSLRENKVASAGESREQGGSDQLLHIGFYGWYVLLVLIGTPFGQKHTLVEAGFLLAALGLHFTYKNYCLHRRFGPGFHLGWRVLLACTPLIAWSMVRCSPIHVTASREVVIAFVAGIVLSDVFREEIPTDQQSRFGWLLAGTIIYGLLTGLEAWF